LLHWPENFTALLFAFFAMFACLQPWLRIPFPVSVEIG
jgi:hypothetical protein